jgi:hypothetical protein
MLDDKEQALRERARLSGSEKAVPTAKTWIIGCALQRSSLQPRSGKPAPPALRRTERAARFRNRSRAKGRFPNPLARLYYQLTGQINAALPLTLQARRGARVWPCSPTIAQELYLNAGRFFSDSLVAPGSTICLSRTTNKL